MKKLAPAAAGGVTFSWTEIKWILRRHNNNNDDVRRKTTLCLSMFVYSKKQVWEVASRLRQSVRLLKARTIISVIVEASKEGFTK